MFDRFRDGDKIISHLNDDEINIVHDMDEQYHEYEFYRRKMMRSYNTYQAKQVLFWEEMMKKHERCETAANRGKILSTCKIDDKLVIVERYRDFDDDELI
jgi:hypothetical protein